MLNWLRDNESVIVAVIGSMTGGIISIIITYLEKHIWNEESKLRELRENQLVDVYAPLKMLLSKYKLEIITRSEVIEGMKYILENYYFS